MAQSIFWHDYETTGTDPARDRAIQFAGVRTDTDLNVIGEPVSFYCYPGDDVIPVPEAIAVTGIEMTKLESEGLRETDFIGRIVEELAQPETCGCGYNSIRFDDEFTRNLLYRNFLDPYAREWQTGNSRWDVIDMFRMCQALRPEGINWPKNDAGRPVFRLQALTAANGIEHEGAHEALADVMATVEMTKKMKAAQPKLFAFLFGLRRKQAVIDQLYPLGKLPIVHVSSMYGSTRQFTAVVLPLCQHPTNSNGVICYDLSHDPEALMELGPEALAHRLFTASRELEQGENRIQLKTIHVNRSPAVAPLATLAPADAERLGIDLDQCHANHQRLMSASGIVEKVQEAYGSQRFPETDDPDLMLYGGDFFSSNDRALMLELRSVPPDALGDVTSVFDDWRVPEMIFRYRARNYPDSLGAEDQARWEAYRDQVARGGEAITKTLERISALRAEKSDSRCLEDLEAWIHQKWSRYTDAAHNVS